MLRQGVQNATQRWQGGIEFIVFMNPDATQEQIDAVGNDLDEQPRGRDGRPTSTSSAAYEEFKQLFADQPELVEQRRRPRSSRRRSGSCRSTRTPTSVEALGEQYETKPGVHEVAFAADDHPAVQELPQRFTVGIFVVAAFLLGAADPARSSTRSAWPCSPAGARSR